MYECGDARLSSVIEEIHVFTPECRLFIQGQAKLAESKYRVALVNTDQSNVSYVSQYFSLAQ